MTVATKLQGEKPAVKLIGENGNVFNIIGRVKRALAQAGEQEAAKEFVELALNADSYDAVLALVQQFTDVE